MKKYTLIFTAFLILVMGVNVFAAEINWEEIAGGESDIKTVLASPGDEQAIYFGSGKGIFSSHDKGANWKVVLLSRGQNRTVNFLEYDNRDKKLVYAACGEGLFYTDNQGEDWHRIFRGKNYQEKECTAVVAFSPWIYLGTKNGLFISTDNGRSWHKPGGKLGSDHILAIAQDMNNPGYVYLASLGGVFKTINNGQTWERIFITAAVEENGQDEEINDDQDEEARSSKINYVILDSYHNSLYLATNKGVYKSIDQGLTWNLLPSYGLLGRNIKFLFVSSDSILYALAKEGVFRYEQERWYECSQGITGKEYNFLDIDKEGNFYLATSKGLFKGIITDNKNKIITTYYKDEPQIKEVQLAAIKYAEVDPEKIANWRKNAAKKAFLPKLSASIDRDTSDLWHWESGSSTKAGDDVLIRGKENIGWDVTLSWDLSEIIWNSDQTSIDVRSRLMVQLRGDIIDEVTKIYFERLRVKMELDNLSIEDRKKRYEKELRLEELSASLDALTGGYFSSQLKK